MIPRLPIISFLAIYGGLAAGGLAQKATPAPADRDRATRGDAIDDAQTSRMVRAERPEQKASAHDGSDVFLAPNAAPTSAAFKNQPDDGEARGFDFYRDPLNAMKPMQSPDEIKAADKQAKPKVMETQKELLEKRYDLTPRFDPVNKMSRGKAIAMGPTARLPRE